MTARRFERPTFLLGGLMVGWTAVTGLAGQNRNMFRFPATGGDRIRTEAQLFPEVSTGPMDPSWSPDGKWIAFSMRGDIWKIPADGGTAIALTKGPAYHFEPAWSPDGRSIAVTVDVNRNLEIGIVPADGGDVRIVAPDPQVDIAPAWSPDGKGLYFSSARKGTFAIYYVATAAPFPRLRAYK